VYIQNGTLPFPYLRYYDNDNGRYYTALTWSWNAGEALLDLTLRNIGRNFEYITSDEQGGTRNPFLDNVVQNQGTKPGNVMQGYNAEAEAIFDAWTSGTVIGAGKTLEAYYTVTLNGNGKYVDFQGNTPTTDYEIDRVVYVKSDGLADHTSTSGWTSPAGLQPTATSSAGPTIAQCWQAINEYLVKFSGSQNNFTFLISYDELPTYTGLLDDFPGAASAYSLRKLDRDYAGYAIRVRRASDNTEQDIGFDSNGDLDTTALATFCSGTDGFVRVWYDQSSNGNDVTQTTSGKQPKIYDSSGGVIEEGSAGNERPAMQFDGSNDGFPYDNTGLDIGSLSSFVVGKYDSTASNQMMLALSGFSSNQRWYAPYLTGGDFNYGYASTSSAMTATANVNQNLHTMIAGSTLGSAEAFLNSTSLGTATLSSGINATDGIMNLSDSLYANGKLQEVVVYDSDQSTNRTGIETNINDYYNIY